MEEVKLDDRLPPPKRDPRTIAREYQLELCERAVKENIIVCIGTGCGKTHIAVLLMHELRHLFTKPKNNICVFLAPTVPLVQQQAVVIEDSTDLKVQSYYGNVKHLKTHNDWENDLKKYEVLVMTPTIFLQSLRHCFIRMELVALLIFDECHHAQLNKRHDYTQIMKEFYKTDSHKCPRVFGMTASPIIGKGGSNQLEHAKYINSLENILHARVCVVDGNAELEAIAASPEISIYFYTSVNIYDSKFMSIYFEKLVESKNNLLSILRDNSTDLKDLKKKMKSLYKVHDDVIFCLENVGLWGAIQASRIFLSNGKDSMIDEVKQYLNKASSCPNCDFLSDNLDTDAFPIKALEEPFLSKKCSVLIEILQEYRERPHVKCILFAKRVIVAKSLTFIIKKMELLEFWRCDYLVGFHSGSGSRHKMNNTVERFRSGEINLLVATKVAEEGLDIPTCCLVIRFDLPETVASFVQSRGRARMPKSKYAFLVERGNQQEKLIHDFLNKEVTMKKEIKDRTCSEIFDCLEETIYRVEATGASISTGYSVMLLHHYCSKLPHDQFFSPAPQFFYRDESKGTVCRIILPSNSPVWQVDSSPCSSKDEAKRFACFNACVELHNLGALTSYLLPEDVGDKKIQEAVKSESKKDEDDELNEEVHETLIPEAFMASFLKFKNSITLYFYFIKFTPFPDDREYRKFGIFLKTYLPKDAETMEVDLHLSHGRIVKAALIPCGTLTFTEEEIVLAQNFQEMSLKIILSRMDFDCDFITLGISESSCVFSSTFYLLLPLFGDDYAQNMNVDWKTVKICLSSPIFSDPEKPIGRIFPTFDSSETLKLANGLVHTRDILNSLVFSPHSKVFYFVVDILHETNGYSKMNGSKKLSHYDFYKEKHNTNLSHPTQPLLKAKGLFFARNLLINRLLDNKEASELDEHFVELVPEVCSLKIIGFSKDIGSSWSLLPSFIHRLENLLVAIQLKKTILRIMPECSQISSSSVLEALTTSKCLERFSLERLEVLGDSFLKYVVARHNFLSYQALDEGQLTIKRSGIVNNLHLYNLAINKKLQEYICDELFEPENFYAPGRPCKIICNHENRCKEDVQESVVIKCNKGHRWLYKKTIADVMEALVGAFLVDCGFNAAIAFLRWIGIEVGFEIEYVRRICDESKVNISMINKVDITSIENLLGYSFLHKGLLLQAFIHPSYTNHSGGCYQRLEFLGDAVLDYLITSYLYSSYPELKPGSLTDLRSIIVSNDSFGRIAVRKGFHTYLLSNTESLNEAMKTFENHLFAKGSEKGLMVDPLCPKPLGDTIESCIGAVLLDSGFDLNRVWTIMLDLLRPALGLNHLSNFRMNPIREIQELCQSWGFKLIFSPPVKENGEFLVKIEVYLKERQLIHHAKNQNSKTAKKLASQKLLSKLEALGFRHKSKSMSELLVTTQKEKAKLIGFDEKPVVTFFDVNELIQLDRLCLNDPEIDSMELFTIEGSTDQVPAKCRLFEICSFNNWNLPSFVCHKAEGPSHLRMFTYKVILEIPGDPSTIVECFGEPQGKKKAAQEHAAEGAIWYLKQLGYSN